MNNLGDFGFFGAATHCHNLSHCLFGKIIFPQNANQSAPKEAKPWLELPLTGGKKPNKTASISDKFGLSNQ